MAHLIYVRGHRPNLYGLTFDRGKLSRYYLLGLLNCTLFILKNFP